MKKQDILPWLRRYAVPVLTAAAGLILLVSPDTASAVAARILAWLLILAGVGFAAAAILGGEALRRGVWAAVCLMAGLWLMGNPLALARIIGRVLGIFLILQGAKGLWLQWENLREMGELIFSAAIALVGLVLLFLPMSVSRIFFSVCGVVLICAGVGEAVHRYRTPPEDGDDPDIIDVEKL